GARVAVPRGRGDDPGLRHPDVAPHRRDASGARRRTGGRGRGDLRGRDRRGPAARGRAGGRALPRAAPAHDVLVPAAARPRRGAQGADDARAARSRAHAPRARADQRLGRQGLPRPLPRGRRADGAPARPPGLTRAPRLVHSPTTGGAATPPPTLGDALAPPASTSSYLGAELVACTVRDRHPGTSSQGNGNRERDGDPTGTPAGRPDLAPSRRTRTAAPNS